MSIQLKGTFEGTLNFVKMFVTLHCGRNVSMGAAHLTLVTRFGGQRVIVSTTTGTRCD